MVSEGNVVCGCTYLRTYGFYCMLQVASLFCEHMCVHVHTYV